MSKVSPEYLPVFNKDEQFENSISKKTEEIVQALQNEDWEAADKAIESYDNLMIEMRPFDSDLLERMLSSLDSEFMRVSGNTKLEAALLKIKDKLLLELSLIKKSDSANKKMHTDKNARIN